MLSALKPDGTEIAGIPVMVKLYAAHRDNADIVKNLVAVIAELTEYSKCQAIACVYVRIRMCLRVFIHSLTTHCCCYCI